MDHFLNSMEQFDMLRAVHILYKQYLTLPRPTPPSCQRMSSFGLSDDHANE